MSVLLQISLRPTMTNRHSAVRNNLFTWQDIQPEDGPGDEFFNFCDALEVKNNESAPASGWGLDHALTAWGSYWKDVYYQEGKENACI